MSSVMRRRRGVMEKVLLGFVAHNIPLSSQRRSGGERLRFDSNRCAFGGCYRKHVPLHTAKRFSQNELWKDFHSSFFDRQPQTSSRLEAATRPYHRPESFI